jgi:DNA-binding IclR family transcriptional regulator
VPITTLTVGTCAPTKPQISIIRYSCIDIPTKRSQAKGDGQAMRGTGSAPTARVVEVVELLAGSSERLRFVEVARNLDINQATAHSILKTLCDKGWAVRDPVDKGFAPGPALAAVAQQVSGKRPLANAARVIATELAHRHGYPASVIERSGDQLIITAFEGDDADSTRIVADRIPFVPPFGVAIAAWSSLEDQRAWVGRARAADPVVADRLYGILARARERGFDIDRTTPALAELAQVVDTLNLHALPQQLRSALDKLRNEFTTAGLPSDDELDQVAGAVATISAPVIDQRGRVTLMIGVHPMQELTADAINTIGHSLTQTIGAFGYRGETRPRASEEDSSFSQ